MNYKKINYIVGVIVFLISASVYLYTRQPTLSFWDCGEFAATAFTVSVPHPPGAPLWTLVGKIATLLPIGANAASKINAISAISSGLTVMFLYLVIVSVIRNWKGLPRDNWDAIMMFGSAAIGALSYAFCDSYWFNALEAEVYAFGTMLIGLCVWLLMVWWEKAEEEHADRYLLLIAFIVGLALGIHLLVVQVILVGGMMYYFRRYQYSRKNFIIAMAITCGAFLLVYPVIVIWYPTWLGGSVNLFKIDKSNVVTFLAALILPALLYGAWWAFNKNKRTMSLAFMAVFLIFTGYSIYTTVLVRAKVDNLPINENEPKDLPALVSYLSREQYGDAPFWPRRYSTEPMHKRTFTNYTSDMDFFWRYQINHMFNRYLGWQYIGRAGYDMDKGIDWSKFYGIPFLIGLFGLFYHFRKDWKLGLTFLWMFVLMGVLTALFQRQQDPQPRERDYFYEGAFFVFSLWIGLGVMGILELIRDAIKNSHVMKIAGVTFLLFGFIFVPGNMARVNFFYNNRHDNYVPYDYAYNLLQGLDKNAILFTNGDNDTFPLWYLQAVEGIRTDVRVVNLSLVNMNWYIKEMKNSMPYGSLKVPISYTDEQIDQLGLTKWGESKMVSVNVPPEAYPDGVKKGGNTPDKLTWKMPYTFVSGSTKAVKVQDLIIYDIIKTNNWQRPVYFSSTVSDDNYIGLDEYLVTEGMGKRIVPYKTPTPVQYRVDREKMYENFMKPPASFSKTPQNGYSFRGFNNPNIFFDEVHQNIVQNYRTQYLTLAYSYFDDHDSVKTAEILDKMEANMPNKIVPMDYRIEYSVAMLYNDIGNKKKFDEMSSDVEIAARNEMKRNPNDIKSYYNPYRILLDIYEIRGDSQKSLEILYMIDKLSPNNPDIKAKIESLKNQNQGK
jgi:hypothetical protein